METEEKEEVTELVKRKLEANPKGSPITIANSVMLDLIADAQQAIRHSSHNRLTDQLIGDNKAETDMNWSQLRRVLRIEADRQRALQVESDD